LAKIEVMLITVDRRPLAEVETDALVVPVFEDRKEDRFGTSELFAAGEVTGKTGELTLLHRPPGTAAKRVLLIGAGKADKFDPNTARKLAGISARHLKQKSVKNIAFCVEKGDNFATFAVEGAILGNFEPDRYRTGDDKKALESFAVAGQVSDAAAEKGRIIGEAQNLTRELVNEPANKLTPAKVADAARSMAAAQGLECEILDEAKMRELGMGALLGVAQGSAEPPAFIVIRYRPTTGDGKVHLGLVGKGVTFDTGESRSSRRTAWRR
jgi:leucyl aminopeptidase